MGEAQGVAYREQVNALGAQGVALVETLKVIGEKGVRITPDIMASGGGRRRRRRRDRHVVAANLFRDRLNMPGLTNFPVLRELKNAEISQAFVLYTTSKSSKYPTTKNTKQGLIRYS